VAPGGFILVPLFKVLHGGGSALFLWARQETGQLLSGFNAQTLRGKLDVAIVSLVLGWGLRRSEVVALKYGDIQRR